MSLTAFALLNGILAGALLAALAYVCRIPSRLDHSEHSAPMETAVPVLDYEFEQIAA